MLIGVQLLLAIHIAYWLKYGSTFTPLEPSEGMQFAQRGIINAGLIFFALVIASTALLGRWFCGWGCHLVALQDGARWLLGKFAIRPRPIRSRLLMTVPLTVFLYMFIAPLVYRLVAGVPMPAPQLHLTTETFWATFPSWLPAALTFLICGGFAVYLLGAKGFCTNGCPYGAAFGAADVLSPMRIRVTDACEHCGHCTAVCSSNVRVHEEVRDFGMVVDPGCMKCLDCVSVCPNDALFYGAGRPTVLVKPLAARRRPDAGGTRFGWLLTVAFMFLTLMMLLLFDRQFVITLPTLAVAATLTAVAAGIAWLTRPRGRGVAPLPLREDLVVGGAFLFSLLVFRGLHDMVAMLFALGLAGCVAFLMLHFLRLLTRDSLSLRQIDLKRSGRLAPSGFAFVALMVLLFVFMGVSGASRVRAVATHRLEQQIAELEPRWSAGTATADELDRLAKLYETVTFWQPQRIDERLNLGLLHMQARRFDKAREVYDLALLVDPDNAYIQANYGLLESTAGNTDAAIKHYQAAVKAKPDLLQAQVPLAQLLFKAHRWLDAIPHLDAALQQTPGDVELALQLTRCCAELGNLQAALDTVDRALQRAPGNAKLLEVRKRLAQMAKQQP